MLTRRSSVFHGEVHLGELDVVPVIDKEFQFPNNEIRIHHLSPGSERCPPLSILQTVSSFLLRCKLHSTSKIEQRHLLDLHACCFHEHKTAIVLAGDEEIHMIAMRSKMKNFPCFWCYSAPRCLYASCLGMLNLRCLAIVFDLDETLIVANTMKSFEDRIETFNGWLARETDPIRISGMSAELKRYLDDRVLLKQYAETDTVLDSGKLYKVLPEEVPPLSDGYQSIIRPVIRLQEKNIVFTRINPENRDTSVLVRLRPAWEELKSYLTANRRKRFEVFVCTMAERDYALEMWRLLDQDANLIESKQLLNRITCVKSGSRKSLQSVFQDGVCHPKMALVIDDRWKVWEEKDQNRVHVVPAFSPYYAPQAETAHDVPVLCVARNVACNVRGGFFKEFDDNLLRQIVEICFEDDIVNLPNVPDVGNFLKLEDTGFVPNCSTNALIAEGASGGEVERRLNQPNVTGSAMHLMSNGIEPRHDISKPLASTLRPGLPRPVLPSQKPGLLGAPGRRDGLICDTDLDAKRRYLVMKHGQDVRNHSLPEPPLIPRSTPVSRSQQQGGWLNEEAGSAGGAGIQTSGLTQEPAPFQPSLLGQPNLGNEKQKHLTRQTQANTASLQNRALLDRGGFAKTNMVDSSSFVAVLLEIGRKCGFSVEFKSIISTSKELQFCFEVLFTGEKIGQGMGKTKKDAQQQAAENALHSLADKYRAGPWCRSVQTNSVDLSRSSENGFIWEDSGDESDKLASGDILPKAEKNIKR